MPVPTRILAAGLALALVSPAYAANEQAPGAQKKAADAPTAATPAPQQQQAPATPAPQSTTKATAKAVTPTTKGSVKKTLATQPATAQGPVHAATPARQTASRRHTSRRPVAHVATPTRSRGAKARRSHGAKARRTRARRGAVVHRAATRSPIIAATAAGVSAPAQTTPTLGTASRVPRSHHTASKAATPLTTITRAADNVVEVIPGTVILALAGLATLVLLLVIRSLATERRRGKALATSYGVTVEALATAIEAKDHTTGGHIERVRRLGLLLAKEIVPREARDPQMAYGFLLHDIGKLAVPDAILRAPGRLTEAQWALMRRHPEEGVRMLEGVPFLDRALDVVRHHHERWDGGGYPEGLRGAEIPLWARIFSVVDALDAITAERPYRAARSYDQALVEIRGHSGTQFDPAIVEALEGLDPAQVEPLLEPAQQVRPSGEPLAELPDVGPLVPA